MSVMLMRQICDRHPNSTIIRKVNVVSVVVSFKRPSTFRLAATRSAIRMHVQLISLSGQISELFCSALPMLILLCLAEASPHPLEDRVSGVKRDNPGQ